MKKIFSRLFYVLILSAMLLIIFTALTSCEMFGEHEHRFSSWKVSVEPTCTTVGERKRTCECGFEETEEIPVVAHAEVPDIAIPATCTEAGKTDGVHCSVCQTVLKKQTTVKATGHKYNDGEIVTEATCKTEGKKKFTCTVCEHTYTEAYSLETLSATELYEQSVKYVGEIITYNKNGSELALGTGFVISSDGEVVTNYHVIDGAYSAKITINEKTYTVRTVRAYDANIDLAILKIDAANIPCARVCKKSVSAGETVYAMGSSRGLTNTYSQGIVTYAARKLDGVTYVQHDASITNGNSGGPLINVYGEVIGINTWGVSDSQNLNFAVFTAELDNLANKTEITLAELCAKGGSTFDRIANYIIVNGEYNSEYKVYSVELANLESNDGETTYTNMAFYYVDDNYISLDMLIDDGDYWAYFVIDESLDGDYIWCYFDLYDNEMDGRFKAATFTDATLLTYEDNNIVDTTTRANVRELASSMIADIVSWMEVSLGDLGILPKDLGFSSYK